MYNLYRFEKDEQNEEKRMNHAKSMKILHRHRKQERNKMVAKYKKRVTDFVGSLEKAPIQPPDEYLTRLREDEERRQKHKFMGGESMMHSLRSDREQIHSYDTDIPEENALKLRPQDKSKEIVPPLRYTFRGDMERIYDQLNNKAYPSIQKKITNIDFEKKMTKFKKNFRTQLNEKSRSEKKFLSPKKVFEELHHKTHFKAAYTIYLNYKSCLQDKAAEEMRRDEDIRESLQFPKPDLRMSHANLNFNKLVTQT